MKKLTGKIDQSIRHQVEDLDKLTYILNCGLPPDVSGHFHLARIKKDTLVIISDSPVWATRIRLLGSNILKLLKQQNIYKLNHISVKCNNTSMPSYNYRNVVSRQLSKKSSTNLSQTADLVRDEKLKAALLKLSKRTK